MKRSLKKRKEPANDIGVVLDNNTDEESYKRYKYIQYRNLVLKSLLTFVLGLIMSAIFKMLFQ